jgi:hypothetical protein
MNYCEIIADNLRKTGWNCGCISSTDDVALRKQPKSVGFQVKKSARAEPGTAIP